MAVAQISGRPRGRPRVGGTDRAVLDAARAILAEAGHDTFTMDAVAARAGVARTTVYRRWPTRDHLALAVAADLLSTSTSRPDGDARKALTRLARAVTRDLRGTRNRRLMAELVVAAARNREVARAFSSFFGERREAAVAAVLAAVERGELAPGTPADTVVDQVVGPLYYRVLVSGKPIDRQYVDTIVDAALAGWQEGGR